MKDNVEVVNMLGGTVSESTRLSLLDFIDNPDEEIKKMQDEEEEQLDRVTSESTHLMKSHKALRSPHKAQKRKSDKQCLTQRNIGMNVLRRQ